MSLRCLLWDFGDTLCDERFIWGSGPEWQAVYELFDSGFGDEWNLGQWTDARFAQELTQNVSLTAEEILAFMNERCKHVEFFPFTYRFYLERNLPQAIVTVNPMIFSDVIEPFYHFDESADVIVTSWEEQTVDKAIMCSIALERLEIDCDPSEALLIDNKQHNVEAWRAKGGSGYHYTTDAQFEADVASGIDGLIQED